jgi:hypothetical protein
LKPYETPASEIGVTAFHTSDQSNWLRNLTVRDPLTNTAGTTDSTSDFDCRCDYTEGELLKKAVAIPLAFQLQEQPMPGAISLRVPWWDFVENLAFLKGRLDRINFLVPG